MFMIAHAVVSRARLKGFDERKKSGTFRAAASRLRDALDRARTTEASIRFLAVTTIPTVVQGIANEYTFEEEPFASGGFASIHKARRGDEAQLAMKRLLRPYDLEDRARLRREIQEQSKLSHEAVMPIIDHDAELSWFVMPLATTSLFQLRKEVLAVSLVEVTRTIAFALQSAHRLGLAHRDVTPKNILLLGEKWVLADWGVVRRPRGTTTAIWTTAALGTDGFAAPELLRDAHNAGPPADVYALGRVVAWAVTGTWPEQNVPLVPEGPWRQFVKRTTHRDANQRASIDDVLKSLDEVALAIASNTLPTDAADLSDEELRTSREASIALMELCISQPTRLDLYVDRLPHTHEDALSDWILNREEDVEALVRTLEAHLGGDGWGRRSFDDANAPLRWLLRIAKCAYRLERVGIFEDVTGPLLRANALSDRYSQRPAIRTWLESVSDPIAAAAVARVLGREDGARVWVIRHAAPQKAHAAIRRALDNS